MKYTQADVTLCWPLKLSNTTLIINKDDFELVSAFPCLLGHPVFSIFKLEIPWPSFIRGNDFSWIMSSFSPFSSKYFLTSFIIFVCHYIERIRPNSDWESSHISKHWMELPVEPTMFGPRLKFLKFGLWSIIWWEWFFTKKYAHNLACC